MCRFTLKHQTLLTSTTCFKCEILFALDFIYDQRRHIVFSMNTERNVKAETPVTYMDLKIILILRQMLCEKVTVGSW